MARADLQPCGPNAMIITDHYSNNNSKNQPIDIPFQFMLSLITYCRKINLLPRIVKVKPKSLVFDLFL